MKLTIAILIIVLITLFIFLAITLWKKARKVIIGVRDGDMQSQLITRVIKKAETTGRIKYTIFRPIFGGIILSILYLLIDYITNFYFFEIRKTARDFLFTFLFLFIVWTIIGIIISNKIWILCRQNKIR